MAKSRIAFVFSIVAIALSSAAPVATTRPRQPGIELFGAPVQVTANDNQAAAEPSLRAARDGTLYIVAPTGLGGARIMESGSGGDLIWRSEDEGRSWEFLGSYDQAAGGGDADIAPDRDGVLWGSGLTIANTTAAVSTDKGETWCVNPVGSLDTVVDRQWIETYKAEPFAFMTTGDFKDHSIILSRLERALGDCPVVVDTVTVSEIDEYQWPGEIAVDEKNDFVYVSYNTCGVAVDDVACEDEDDQIIDRIVVARTNLELGNPKRFVVTRTLGDSFDSFTALDVDRAGNLYVAWTERRPSGTDGRRGRTNSYLSVGRNNGKSWTDPVKLNRWARTTAFPWIVAGSAGRVAVTYYGTRHLGPSPESISRPEAPPAKWKVFLSYSLNAHRKNTTFTETRVTNTMHEGDICTSGTDCAPGTRDLLDFFQIDLDPCGKMIVSYTDNSRDEVVTGGARTSNQPERVAFVGQTSGPRFYATPLDPAAC